MTLVNGYLSLAILLERSCNQGDPVAGYLFILTIGVLMLRIAESTKIKLWISHKNNFHLQDCYVNDPFIFLEKTTRVQQVSDRRDPENPGYFRHLCQHFQN